MVQRYLTSEAGAKGFQLWLKEHGYHNVMNPVEVKQKDKVFHYLISTTEETFYCLFKHDFFYTFPDKYKEFFVKYPNLNSAGESINVERLVYCNEHNFTLIFISENGFFYEIKPSEILKVNELAKEFYPNGFVREQDKINRYIDGFAHCETKERTISFPLKALSRFLN
jgi:hypothetical protein